METSATIGTLAGNALYSYSAHDDGDGRLAESTVKRVSDNATLFDELLSYDPVGNVAGIATTLASGVDHQQFCYDEHNRLTWASATQGATGPCGAIIGANTVPGASYTQSFSYDTLDRLTSGPAGSYSYGDSAHLHGATTVGSGSTAYTARYDAAGDMVCRAPTGSTSCAGGTNTGQQLTWDLEGRLAAWQDAPTSPTTTASYLYDGEGQRVAQRVTASGTTTTTTYVGSLAEYATTGGTTSRTDYLYAAGKLVAEAVTSGTPSTTTLTYLVANAQGTPLEALDGSGNVTASRLYTPYGASRYTSGAFPTSYGYTGQRNDATTGLDYYGARYYDPAIGQFTSADTVRDGLSRYGYVGGNPTSATDPSGHMTELLEKEGELPP